MRSTGLAKPFASRWLAAVDVTASIVCLNAPTKVRHSDTYIERGKASFAGPRLARFAIFLPVREERLRDEPNRKSVCEAKATPDCMALFSRAFPSSSILCHEELSENSIIVSK